MNKKISLLGSTGSIGLNTIQVIQFYKFYFQIESLSAHKNIEELRKQILEFRPKKAVITDLEKYREFIHLYGNPFYKCKIYYGYDALIDLVQDIEVDIVINALVGIYGLKPSLEAIRKNKTLAIANKETIIVSGSLLMRELKKSKGQLIPIDSEHSALFSLIGAFNKEKIKKLFLTASGGAIYNRSLEDLEHISLEEILLHPNWKMGKKLQ